VIAVKEAARINRQRKPDSTSTRQKTPMSLAESSAGTEDYIRAVTKRALQQLRHTQPWPLQFRRRSLEVRSLCRLHDFSSGQRVLELGCGNAFGSALLSQGREQIVATDLADENVATHSIGLSKARALLDGLGLNGCEVTAASGDALPYPNGSFDLVFSLFVLEHVPDRDACLTEVRRVLDEAGLTVHAVPGSMWAGSAIPRFYLYLLQRLWIRLSRRGRGKVFGPDGEPIALLAGETPPGLWRLFRTRYPQFPLPPPHGTYRNHFDELINYSRGRWMRLFERNGFEVLHCRPTMVLPLDLLQSLLGERGLRIYERLFELDQWLARQRLLWKCGQFLGIVARKRK